MKPEHNEDLLMKEDLFILTEHPSHVKSVQIKSNNKTWQGAVFFDNNVATDVVRMEADTLQTLLEMIEDEIYRDMPEHDPDPSEVA